MAEGDNRYRRDVAPTVPSTSQQRASTSQNINVNLNGATGTTGGTANAATLSQVATWARTGNVDPIPASKLTNAPSGGSGIALASRGATYTLPAVAATTLTATMVNIPVQQKIASLTGSDVAGYISNSVVNGAARITFPKEGFISGNLEANIIIHSSSAGTSGNTAHFNVKIGLFSSSGTVKEYYRHSEVIHDPVTRDSIDPVTVPITFTPIDAGDYIEVFIAFESSNTGRTINFEIPAHDASRREQLDIFFYDRATVPGTGGSGIDQEAVDARIDSKVEGFARVGHTATIDTSRLPGPPTILNQTQVDARVLFNIEDWAEQGNVDDVPRDKLPTASATEQGAVTLNTVDGRIASWARTGQTQPVSGLTQAQVDARVQAGVYNWAEQDNSDQIPASKLQNAPGAQATAGLNTAQVTALIATWARATGATGTIPASRLPAASRTVAGIITTANIEQSIDGKIIAQIEAFARKSQNVDVPRGKLPAGNATERGALSLNDVDSRIATWARTGRSQPVSLTQNDVDARINTLVEDFAKNANSSLVDVAKLPDATASAKGAVTLATIDGRVHTWARLANTDEIPTAKLPKASTTSGQTNQEGIVDVDTIDSRVATWARAGQTAPSGGLNTAAVDARIATWARAVSPTGTIPNTVLPQASTTNTGTQGIISIASVDARVAPWARAGQTAPSGGTSGLDQAQVDARVQALTADWAEQGNASLIPDDKLPSDLAKEVIGDFGVNDINVLRDISESGTASFVELPSDYATFNYLLFGGSANAEYGIVDVRYLDAFASLPEAALEGAYSWNKSTRRITGTIKGAYLVKLDAKNFYQAGSDWLREVRTNTQQLTTYTNDGFEGVDVAKATADAHDYFAFRLHDVDTQQFLPKELWQEISANDRYFRVWDEDATKVLKVGFELGELAFNSYNQAGSAEINQMRSAALVSFPVRNELINDSDATATTYVLPTNYKDSDLLIAVTKNTTPANTYTIWTIKAKFANRTITEATRVFNPSGPIVYLSLVKMSSALDIQARDVSVDDADFDNITGDNVQAALNYIDDNLGGGGGGTVTTTPNRGTAFPTSDVQDGDEFNLTVNVAGRGSDIQPENFADTFFGGEGWGTRGYALYLDTQGGRWSLGHASDPLPQGVLAITDTNIIVADGQLSDLTYLVFTNSAGVVEHRTLTRTDRNNYPIGGGQFDPNVDSYTYDNNLPAGAWNNVYILRRGGTGDQINTGSLTRRTVPTAPLGLWISKDIAHTLQSQTIAQYVSTLRGASGGVARFNGANPTLYREDRSSAFDQVVILAMKALSGLGYTDAQIRAMRNVYVLRERLTARSATVRGWNLGGATAADVASVATDTRISKIAFPNPNDGNKYYTYQLNETVAGPSSAPVSIGEAGKSTAYELDFTSNPFQTSTGVSGRLTGTGTVREKGVYRRKEALWQDQTYNAPEADVTKSLKLLAEETLPGGPQDLSLDFATISGTVGVNNPFPGIVRLYYDPRTGSGTNTSLRWVVLTPHDIPPEQFPKTLKVGSLSFPLSYFQVDTHWYYFVTQPTTRASERVTSGQKQTANIQLTNLLWLGQVGEKRLNKTIKQG